MKREIKFRAWDKKHKRMFDVHGLGKDWVTEDTMDGINPGVNAFSSDEFKNCIDIMQFTGLKDKNRNEIYEEDLLKINGIHEDYINRIWKVVFYNYSFGIIEVNKKLEQCNFVSFDRLYWDSINHDKNYTIEKIGNIYENKDLLNEKTH